MANPLFGRTFPALSETRLSQYADLYSSESHCKITENRTTIPNSNAWSENYNLVALDHVSAVSAVHSSSGSTD